MLLIVCNFPVTPCLSCVEFFQRFIEQIVIELFQRTLTNYYVIGDLFFIYVRRDYRAVVVVQITLADTAAQGSFYDNIIS